MAEKMLARVAVSSVPYAADKLYTYRVPDELKDTAAPGKRVLIPFGRGNRRSEGFVLDIVREEDKPAYKPIDAFLDDMPLLDSRDIRLARWMKARYFCTYYDALKTLLPGGVWLKSREVWKLNEAVSAEEALAAVMPDTLEETLLCAVLGAKGAERAALNELGGERTGKALRTLEQQGLLVCETTMKQRLSDKTARMVSLCVSAEDALAAVEPKRRSAPVRNAVVELLSREGTLSSAEISYYTGATMQTLRGLKKSGLVEFSEQEVLRVSSAESAEKAEPFTLNGEQQAAFEGLSALLGREGGSAALLYGVTASGKTQVYLKLIEETLRRGRSAMLLVPEIALTPQMMRRFSAQFGPDVVMLHSALPLTERYDQWKRIRRGEVRVVLGTRSAVFAPLPDLGLIILDEEQEGSYQSENPPRYHARDIAQFRCAQRDALMLLGSATPTVETAYYAKRGRYQVFSLHKRFNDLPLPKVLIADMKDELRQGNETSIGHALCAELEKKPRTGRAEHPVSQPARQREDAPLRRVRLCARVSAVQCTDDLPFGKRAADVPLLRPFRSRDGTMQRVRRTVEARRLRHTEGRAGACRALSEYSGPAHGRRHRRRRARTRGFAEGVHSEKYPHPPWHADGRQGAGF